MLVPGLVPRVAGSALSPGDATGCRPLPVPRRPRPSPVGPRGVRGAVWSSASAPPPRPAETLRNPSTAYHIRTRLSDILHLRFLEVPGLEPTPQPPRPIFPYSQEQRRSASTIAAADVESLRRCTGWWQWWAGQWRVPLQPDYDPDLVAHYFLRRPHLLALRMLQVGVFLSGAWVLIASDTLAIRSAEADGVPSDSAAISAIRRRSAKRLKRALLSLGPTFVKVAQSISTRPDIVGPDTAAVLAELQDRLPPFPTVDALQVIEEDLQLASAGDAYAMLGAEPVAAASLGQVYRGVTRDGRAVAVKVQRPGVLLTVARDICILRLLLRLLRHVARINSDLGLLADELGRGLFGELDYRREAANAEAFASAHAHLAEVVVPGILHALTSRRVLTMDWVDGDRTADLLRLAQLGTTLDADEDEDAGEGEGHSLWGWWVPAGGGSPSAQGGAGPEAPGCLDARQAEEAKELARAKLLTMVGIGVECSLEQLLGSGLLHADPHPGNLLLTRGGRLAYLDFGLLCRMERPHQAAMLAAIAHLVNAEWAKLTEDLARMDVLKPATDRKAVTMALEEAFAASVDPGGAGQHGDTTLQFGQISSSLWKMALRFRFRLPPYYTLVLRSLASLEGIAIAVDPNFRVFACAYPFVVRRLLTDSSPTSQQVLRDLVLTPDGRLRWERFAAFAISSSLASREDAISLASPSLWSLDRQSGSGDRALGRPGAEQAPEGATEAGAAWPSPTGGAAGVGLPVRPGRRSKALLLLELLLSQEATSTRRMLLDSDVPYLAEAFVSAESAPARAKLAETISEAVHGCVKGWLWGLGWRAGAGAGGLAVTGPTQVPPYGDPRTAAVSPLTEPWRLLSGSISDGGTPTPSGAQGHASGRSGAFESRVTEKPAHGNTPGAAFRSMPSTSASSRGSSALPPEDSGRPFGGHAGAGPDARDKASSGGARAPQPFNPSAPRASREDPLREVKRKRLWVLVRSAFARMGGSPLLKLKVILVACVVLITAIVLALKSIVVESALQIWRLLHQSSGPASGVA